MGTTYLLDSNVVIDLLNGKLTTVNPKFVASVRSAPIFISIITKIEVLAWNAPTDEEAIQLIEFVETATVLPLSDDIAEKTIALRKMYRKIKLPDTIIAATALVHSFHLITRNTSDFLNLPGLQVVNPFEL